ncbi:MAG TPA: Uma2 family endonuclease [Blastocatellia bacterium]|nr:Uma2 family endonuclease [Blastocatellia bacterium]HMX30396.1 Uma2 family endonuclease [Blastocatellia bacterium]HMY73414.1 Uma2 family endonuclease [Blastocatellia bacterium]HMZ18206.1 Uma2 family endonuclease [Blastocatellia bacterium]HNG34782.1 Uma2 family endonuclease [Blastocatellia bacterium]
MATSEKELVYRYTPEEYLAFERASKTKHEYLDGEIYAMAGGSPKHNQICFNAIVAVGAQIKGTSCVGYTSDQKIRTTPEDMFAYPDLTIICGDPVFHDDHQDVILNPTVIIEVLSPRTELFDRNTKFERYQKIPALTDYILISQDRPCVEHYARRKGNRQWTFTMETDLSAEIEIASIKAGLKLADIYERVMFPSTKELFATIVPNVIVTPKKPKRRQAK